MVLSCSQPSLRPRSTVLRSRAGKLPVTNFTRVIGSPLRGQWTATEKGMDGDRAWGWMPKQASIDRLPVAAPTPFRTPQREIRAVLTAVHPFILGDWQRERILASLVSYSAIPLQIHRHSGSAICNSVCIGCPVFLRGGSLLCNT